MSRAFLILGRPDIAERAINWIRKAPRGTRLLFQAPKRSKEQSDRMWAMLTDFARQADHHGQKWSPDQWKCVFMHALGQEMTFIPSLDGRSFIPYGNRSSELSVAEMTALMDLIEVEAARRGVTLWKDDPLDMKEAA